ncbi:hypothetical protein HOK51_11200 [Candidatus Woesearchaeota archaeon]|jgi:hypothetical protein|nr:hypothetical protein [Candidatus Woesearchaeota archaeon]MBT6520389.1 hypothetical protein [Candidatus Woesearchaeota archaeon]MBT7368720.1 hypothetical protein [Candidatus Woesearchaeota archaeon]
MTIRNTSMKHGWFYHYRLNDHKIDFLCCNGFESLRTYLDQVFTNCPDHYFESGPRGSSLKFKLGIKPIRVEGHEVSQLADVGLKSSRYKTAHSNVQVHMLEQDGTTIGVEVPIWLQDHEIKQYKAIFDSDEPLTGHIDIVRIEDGKIWVWDFKPKADLEKYASTQIYFYALMLSKRTNISLDKFRCGYFDEYSAHIFKPEQDQLDKFLELKQKLVAVVRQ